MAYVPGNPPDTGQPNLERYLGEEFHKIRQQFNQIVVSTLRLFVAKGYGGIDNAGQQEPTGDWGLAYQPVDGFVNDTLATPVDVTQDASADNISINRQGVWSINFLMVAEHNETQASRYIELQMRDEDAGTTLLSFLLFTARNQGGTTFSGTFLADITSATAGKKLTWRIGNGSIYTNVIYNSLNFSAVSASELQGISL